MPDYKQMYLALFRASVQANNILQQAHRQAEEAYLSSEEAPIFIQEKMQPPPQGE